MRHARPIRWFQQLRWKLSLLYTSVTVMLIFIGLGVGEVIGYYHYRSLYRPEAIAQALAANAWQVGAYIPATPVNAEGVTLWLKDKAREIQGEECAPGSLSFYGNLSTEMVVIDARGVALVSQSDPATASGLWLAGRVPPSQASLINAALRGEQEALANVARHSHATRAVIEVGTDQEDAILSIMDNGAGFDPGKTTGGMGLQNMRERAEALPGGWFKIDANEARGVQVAAGCHTDTVGETTIHPRVAAKMMQALQGAESKAESPFDHLSKRELEVLRLIAEGLSNAAIGEALFISEKTVKSHVGNILSKLHLADRTQAAVYAWRRGLIE